MYSVEIAMTKAVAASEGKIIFEPKVFNPDAKKTIVEAFDKEEYTPIVEQIDKEIKDLQDFRTENEKPFTENAFAKVSIYNPILLNKIDESIRKLEDIKCKLKEVHDRYDADDNIISEYKVGDCILKDGSYKKASEKRSAIQIGSSHKPGQRKSNHNSNCHGQSGRNKCVPEVVPVEGIGIYRLNSLQTELA